MNVTRRKSRAVVAAFADMQLRPWLLGNALDLGFSADEVSGSAPWTLDDARGRRSCHASSCIAMRPFVGAPFDNKEIKGGPIAMSEGACMEATDPRALTSVRRRCTPALGILVQTWRERCQRGDSTHHDRHQTQNSHTVHYQRKGRHHLLRSLE